MSIIKSIKDNKGAIVAAAATMSALSAAAAATKAAEEARKELAEFKRREEEREREREMQENLRRIEVLGESIDAYFAARNKRNVGLVEKCPMNVKLMSAMLKKDSDWAVSQWLFTKLAIPLDAFMRGDEDFVPDNPNEKYHNAVESYKKMDETITSLDKYKGVMDLLDANMFINVVRAFFKDTPVYSMDKIDFDEDVYSRWKKFSRSANKGCTWIFSTYSLILFIFFFTVSLVGYFAPYDPSQSSITPIFIIGILGLIFGVVPHYVLFTSQIEEMRSQQNFIKEFIGEWNTKVNEVNSEVKKYEAMRVPLRNALEENIYYYSNVILDHLEKSPIGDNVRGSLPKAREIEDNIVYLENEFPKNTSYLTEETFERIITEQTGVPSLEKDKRVIKSIMWKLFHFFNQ